MRVTIPIRTLRERVLMKQNHRVFTPVRSVLAAALAFAALPAAAQTYSQTVFFGDSLTDSGWFRPTLVQVAGPQAAILGRFSTNPTQVWSEYLADYYGTNATSAGRNQPESVRLSPKNTVWV